ncbi:alpha/beta hydrolase [uncultured Litoreibacter sp.]|uniref:alpha/beta hydrolase n=1 Tax=uncultured Litoreibacter sp. TaxID=1392394 RepID=UPI0026304D1A|nr:alpha/beta hydrolase [uncultured Litoreibacter sp.]
MISKQQKGFNALSRYLQKPMLAHVGNQRLLNRIFGLMAYSMKPLPGTQDNMTALGGVPTRQMTPPQAAGNTLLYLHGGGFTIGSSFTYRWLAARIADQIGATAYLPDYRLGDRHAYPAAPEDCLAAYRVLLQQTDAKRIVIAGDSAGGCLALNTLTRAAEQGLPMPAALGLLSPLTDLTGSSASRQAFRDTDMVLPHSWVTSSTARYLAGHDATDPQASPAFADLSTLPPTLVQIAEGEMFFDEAVALGDTIPDASVDIWQDVPHGWQLAAGRSPEADEAVTRMAAFLRSHLP